MSKIAPGGLNLEERLHWHGWTVLDSGCWDWGGYRHRSGYGQIRYLTHRVMAHRAAYETWVGPIPDGLLIRHKCDNRACINPDHLEPGTSAENSRDMVERGRSSKLYGEDHHRSRLTWEDVRWIRKGYEGGLLTQSMLAEALGVHRATVQGVISGRRYPREQDPNHAAFKES